MKDKIMVTTEDCRSFDKMQIAMAIRNSTYEDELSCSLLENGILKNCSSCSLNYVCQKLDAVAEEYTDSTTTVVSSFSFQN